MQLKRDFAITFKQVIDVLTFSPFAPGRPTNPAAPGEPGGPSNPCNYRPLSSLYHVRIHHVLWENNGLCHLLGVQEHRCPPSLPLSRIQAHPALEHRNSECQTTCRTFHHMLHTWSCSLTLGPGIPCSPWKTLCTVSVKATGADNTLELNSLYLDFKVDLSTHHGPRNPWWARWARWAWLWNHLNLMIIEMTEVKQEQRVLTDTFNL